jgi:aryl-alcohol dehydrogenase-like predicted oxidoreductase
MEYRSLGSSEVKVTPIAFGSWAIGGWLWGGAEENDAIQAIKASYDLGITTFDTAPAYGFGKSEELIGRAMEGIPRNKYQVLTKFGLDWTSETGEYYFDTTDNDGNPVKMYRNASPARVIKECEDSLRRLKTDYVDLLQIHWSDNTTPIAETMEAVAGLIKQGKVLAAGVCNYSVNQVNEALKIVPLASNQVPFSMVRRDIEKDLVPQALEKGLSILPYSPLQRGLLTGKITRDYKFNDGDSRPDTKYFKPESIDKVNAMLERIRPIADVHNATLSQVIINWTAHLPAMTCVLVGARDEKQVSENVGALDFKLTQDQMDYISQLANEVVIN